MKFYDKFFCLVLAREKEVLCGSEGDDLFAQSHSQTSRRFLGQGTDGIWEGKVGRFLKTEF